MATAQKGVTVLNKTNCKGRTNGQFVDKNLEEGRADGSGLAKEMFLLPVKSPSL